MEREQAKQYFQQIGELKKIINPPRAEWKTFLEAERDTTIYQEAFTALREEAAERKREQAAQNTLAEIPASDFVREEEVVVNPLTREVANEETLSPNQRAILWANRQSEAFLQINASAAGRRRQRTGFLKQTAKYLLDNPADMDTVMGIWKRSEEPRAEETPDPDSLSLQVQVELETAAEKGWKGMTPEQLHPIYRTYAHSEHGKDAAQAILRGYFKGPKTRTERVGALYNSCFNALDMIEDAKALEQTLLVLNFKDTDVLPQKSDYYRDFYVARNAMYTNDELLRLAMIVDNISYTLLQFTTVDQQALRQENQQFATEDRGLARALDQEVANAFRQLGQRRLERKAEALNRYTFQEGYYAESQEEAERIRRRWPYNLRFGTNDPLVTRYQSEVEPIISAKLLNDSVDSRYRSDGYEGSQLVTVPMPDESILNICIPRTMLQHRQRIIRAAMEIDPGEDIDALLRQPNLEQYGTAQAVGSVDIDGYDILFWHRRAAEIEKKYHPLMGFEAVGFPKPATPDNKPLAEASGELAGTLRSSKRLRYLNKRGVQVPFTGRYRRFGYEQVKFQKEAGTGMTRVEFILADRPYVVRLDKYFEFNLEGRSFPSRELYESLQYTVLLFLEEILCKERIQTDRDQDPRELHTQIQTRMGHLRLLPEGYKYSAQAVTNHFNEECESDEDPDLITISENRQNAFNTTRHTTYVVPVDKSEGNLDAITARIGDQLVPAENN